MERLAIDWEKLERDVSERIKLLAAADRGIQHTEIGAKLQHDLIVPAVGLLAQFVECVHVEEGEDDHDQCFTKEAGVLVDCEGDGWYGCRECARRIGSDR